MGGGKQDQNVIAASDKVQQAKQDAASQMDAKMEELRIQMDSKRAAALKEEELKFQAAIASLDPDDKVQREKIEALRKKHAADQLQLAKTFDLEKAKQESELAGKMRSRAERKQKRLEAKLNKEQQLAAQKEALLADLEANEKSQMAAIEKEIEESADIVQEQEAMQAHI